ncbi:hypothetical protein [Methylobacterium sp. J-088]|nr:hypothetical protein [Methylobacterium sp. J-088]
MPDNLIDTFDGTVACADPGARIHRRPGAGLRVVGLGPAATLRMVAGPAA